MGDRSFMRQKIGLLLTIFIIAVMIVGCGGKVRYSQSVPEAKGFHPEGIAVLSVVADDFPEAQGKGEQIITDVLSRKGWFKKVTKPELSTGLREKDETLRKAVSDYLNKLKTVNFSDPDLSKKIGETCGVQALIFARIDLWNYSDEGGKKLAKVGMEVKLISTDSGKVMWRANHNKIEDYMVLKPDLTHMAKSLVDDMVSQMPR